MTPLQIALASLQNLEIRIVMNGKEALAVIELNYAHMAALITDLNLPHLDGYELIAAVRADPRATHLPVIVVSGDNDPNVRTRVRSLGANAFFAKPYSPLAVRETLESLLNAK